MDTKKHIAPYEDYLDDYSRTSIHEVLPAGVRIDTYLTPGIKLNIPICSAGMTRSPKPGHCHRPRRRHRYRPPQQHD